MKTGSIAKRLIPITLLIAVTELGVTSLARADSVVTSCDGPSLQQAVNVGGLVTFDCAGVITLTNTILISLDTIISGTGQTISGGSSVAVFAVPAGVTLTLEHLNIINGKATLEGGGVLNQGTLGVAHCTFINNTVTGSSAAFNGKGGAISNHGTLTVGDTFFGNNSAVGLGGAIYNNGNNTCA